MISAPVLQLAGISKRFGAIQANEDISLSLAKGEVLALLGENGAGKTTLMSILFGHYVPDAGTIQIEGTGTAGRPAASGDPRRHRHGAPAFLSGAEPDGARKRHARERKSSGPGI